MSETPKYDLRGSKHWQLYPKPVQSGGRQEATQHIYAPERDFNKLLADYQQFFNDLQQKYPTQPSEAALQPIIDAEFQEIQKTQPQRWQSFLNLKRLWNGGKKATFKMGEHFTEESLWGKAGDRIPRRRPRRIKILNDGLQQTSVSYGRAIDKAMHRPPYKGVLTYDHN